MQALSWGNLEQAKTDTSTQEKEQRKWIVTFQDVSASLPKEIYHKCAKPATANTSQAWAF